jgi:uncharacterized membrane protein
MSEPMQDPISPTPPPSPQVAAAPTAATSGLSDNVVAALAYVTIIPAIIFLMLEPYNRIPLVRFHSFQSIAFCVLALVLQVGLAITEGFLHFIPLSWMVFPLVHLALGLGLFIAWLIAILKAFKGEFYKLPFIGDFAQKQARS